MKLSPQNLTLYTIVFLVIALAGLIAWQRLPPTPSAPAAPFAGDFELEDQPLIGDPDAPATIVAFEDFKCPVCKAFEEDAYPQIVNELVETGQANMYFMNFQFIGPDSTTAGIAGECAYRQDEAAFWDYKTYIYRAQGPESEEWATPELLVDLAREYVPALDADALAQCIDERRYEDAVAADREIGDQAGVDGTPSLFVNGQKLESWDYATVQAAVEAAQP
jgi:protein-disulfide isomerase